MTQVTEYTPRRLAREARAAARASHRERRNAGEATTRPRNVLWTLRIAREAVQLVVEWQEGDGANHCTTVAL